ncbi:helix-turn-helix domain-containing protein [Pseudoxanthomonas suwonensis]|uniref:helix-turn-helix domain-containing protein n=1 Tax=Pseudoxanthomonas suwonensis TaxID=314722 RepID=UPI00138F3E3A|nr:helix-turn-helix domain-containing protein [Pseudoxanthomonas suwonensis]KAF1704036.1 hypothetical protein CSC68_03495 [Pseudoxanthomonas suwonensis]
MPPEARDRPFVLRWRSAVLNAPLTATQKLCLLVLAEWADADGGNCWPAMASIAEKASVNERTVRRCMEELDELGWFTRSHRRSQKGWKQFGYTLTIPDAADTVPCRTTDVPDTLPGSDPASTGHSEHLHRTLATDAPGTVSTDLALPIQDLGKEESPSPKRKVTRIRSQKLTFAEWMQTIPDDQQAVPEGHHVFRYAQRVGLPIEFLHLCWCVFQAKHETDSKRQADWLATFRRAAEDNWYRLWWIDDSGQYQLTTQGKQADRLHETNISSTRDPNRLPRLVA